MEVSEYVDIVAVCRICLAQQGNVIIFERELHGYSVAECIMSFASVEAHIDDGLPDKICLRCLDQIDQAFKLKAQCEYADATLKQLCTEGNLANNVVCFLADSEECTSRPHATQVLDKADSSHIKNVEDVPDLPASIMDECSNLDEILGSDNESSLKGPQGRSLSTNKENKCISVDLNNDISGELVARDPQKLPKKMRKRENVACVQCGEQFPNKKRLEAHGLSQPGHRPFLCDLCGKRFKRLSNLKEHEKKHTGVLAFLCSNCGESASAKKYHYCPAGHESNEEYSCNICKKKFVSQSSLGTHKKRHKSESKFKCEECGKLYFSRQELERHLRVHFNIRPFQCTEESCSLMFFSKGELNRHMRYHRGLRRFSCDMCGQKFFESGHLATHQRKHTGERPYNCHHCLKTFSDSSKLRRHSLAHMKPSTRPREIVVGSENLQTVIEGSVQGDEDFNVGLKITLENSGNANSEPLVPRGSQGFSKGWSCLRGIV